MDEISSGQMQLGVLNTEIFEVTGFTIFCQVPASGFVIKHSITKKNAKNQVMYQKRKFPGGKKSVEICGVSGGGGGRGGVF